MDRMWNINMAGEYQKSIRVMEQRVEELKSRARSKSVTPQERLLLNRRINNIEVSLRDMTMIRHKLLHYYDKD